MRTHRCGRVVTMGGDVGGIGNTCDYGGGRVNRWAYHSEVWRERGAHRVRGQQLQTTSNTPEPALPTRGSLCQHLAGQLHGMGVVLQNLQGVRRGAVNVNVNELRLGFSNTTRNPEVRVSEGWNKVDIKLTRNPICTHHPRPRSTVVCGRAGGGRLQYTVGW